MALTDRGIQQVIPGPDDLPGYHNAARKTAASLRAMYSMLQRQGEATGNDLLDAFVPIETTAQPRKHAHNNARAWWADVGAEQFAALEGIEAPDDPQALGAEWRFTGVDPADFDDEVLVDLDELQEDPVTRAERRLDELDAPPGSEHREAVIELFTHLVAGGEQTSADLERSYRGYGVPFVEIEDLLASLGDVEREQRTPPDPASISIETYQDVLDAKAAVERDPETVWSYSAN